MGAVTFSIDPEFIRAIHAHRPLNTFFESGTFKGDTLAIVEPHFQHFHSVEFSASLYDQAKQRFAKNDRIGLYQGNSPDILKKLADQLSRESVLYWLDAHWCAAEGVANDVSQCPLLDEIAAIGCLNEDSILMIDDARYFLAPPPAPHEISEWPTFDAILRALRKISDLHAVMVLNDVILFFPPAYRQTITDYARAHGHDLWKLRQQAEQYATLRKHSRLGLSLLQRINRLTTRLRK